MSDFSRRTGPRRTRRSGSLFCLLAAAVLLAGCSSSVAGDPGAQSGQLPPNPPGTPAASSADPVSSAPTSQDGASAADSAGQDSSSAATAQDSTSDTGASGDTTAAPSPATSSAAQPETSSDTSPATSSATSSEAGTEQPDTSVAVTTVVHTATVTAAQGNGAVLKLDHFSSPSGNISCLITTDTKPQVRCDLADSQIPKDHDCGGTGDWGLSVTLVAGQKAAMECISDTVMQPGIPALAYGQKTTVGAITCTSAEDGIHCADASGHGFRLARASYDVS